ncbi:MAG: glycosyltransferase family 39 protein [Bacteroidetes bacterium]|nr:glycosyltransferase family 39 protein [Bacteroidota bacterium]
MPSNRKIYWAFFILLFLSALVRGFIAGFIELGNDEVYYLTYAEFPALSHFDHPPMVGLVIQLFTFNLTFSSEFFIRLASVVLGTISTGLMFLIGRQIKGPLTGLYAALLFTGSFYGFILSGTFILPDTPQVVFWLLTLFLALKALPDRELMPESRRLLLLAGVTAGLAMLSKYHSVFLITGVFIYILIYNRRWFRATETYGALLLYLLLCTPVVLWNIENNFISFTYHENRVGITASGLQLQYFLTEIAGEIFYNNPVNVVIIITAFVALIRGRQFIRADYRRIILWISVPLVLVFMSFSLFRSTLPHWTGPGYLGFILIAAAYLSEPAHPHSKMRLVPWPLVLSLALLMLVAVAAVGQIGYGWVPLSRWKVKDISHDMTGWKQLGEKFAVVAKQDTRRARMQKGSPIFTFRWFPAANLDYYAGRQTGLPVYALGTLERIHKYHWINRIHGNLRKGSDAYYIALSDDYEDPVALYGTLFDTIQPADTIYITRRQDTVRKAFVYRMKNLKKEMVFSP